MLLKNAHLRRCAAKPNRSTYVHIRLAIRFLRALYLSIFEHSTKKEGIVTAYIFREVLLMKIWDPTSECMSRDELEQLQLERLQATINRVHKNVHPLPEKIC